MHLLPSIVWNPSAMVAASITNTTAEVAATEENAEVAATAAPIAKNVGLDWGFRPLAMRKASSSSNERIRGSNRSNNIDHNNRGHKTVSTNTRSRRSSN